MALDYIWDDHDYGDNDSDETNPGKEAVTETYKKFFPHYPLKNNILEQP